VLAYEQAVADGLEVRWLLHVGASGRRREHALGPKVLQMQADAIGVELLEEPGRGYGGYEGAFARMIDALKPLGLSGLICGDVLSWGSWAQVREVCAQRRIDVTQPLLSTRPRDLLTQCIAPPFKATVIAARRDSFRRAIVGMPLDDALMEELLALGDIEACGEDGEYHTLVLNAGSFRHGLAIADSEPSMNETHWLLNVDRVRIAEKRS
jgi:uncharacterized protein (TIGR00290 family)